MTSDHLGSPRIVTDQTGKVISRHDYLAFGDEVTDTVGNVGGRSSAQGYGAEDDIRKQYTGYEKDEESGLDFAQARYYNGKHGRFTSVDPLTASANVKDPQTFNRYSYAMNSPYKFTDPLGLISSSTSACGNQCSNSGSYVDGSAFRGTDGSGVQPLDRQTAEAAEHAPPAAEQNAVGLIRIPGLEIPEVDFLYPGSVAGQDGFGTPLPEVPAITLPKTSAAANAFLKAISPYVESTAVLNLIESVTGTSTDTISTTVQGQIAVAFSEVMSATPSTTAGGTVTGTLRQTTTEKGATTLTARTELSAKIVALTLQHQESIKAALVADRDANKMSVLSDATLLKHTTTVMNSSSMF